ncbi:hypothetical protein Taro_054053 [Colocasia esculenta]|uniref:Uncharacterized protein n=1 Tax=Colocasia esculenta TaxID=4460 RepID=A0A843XPC6_COLES|nr:hypothetical protein [Colocasia esculenta]
MDASSKEGLSSSPGDLHAAAGQTFSCKGSVDTTINGVDTMAQSKGRNVKKRSTSVDTSLGSTRDDIRSTLESLPRRPVLLSGTWCRH